MGGQCEAQNRGMTPAGNGACDVRAAANALHTLFFFSFFTTIVHTEAICKNVCLREREREKKMGNSVWNSKMFKIVYVTKRLN